MKKIILFIIISFYLAQSVLAISTDIKPTYFPGETLIAEISGNILEPVKNEDVLLKRENVQVPFSYDLKKLGDRYFIYGNVPLSENNYTLIIKNITTTLNGKITKIDFNQTFEVTGQIISYSISPGFIITSNDFNIIFKSNLDSVQEIQTSIPDLESITLKPGENKIKIPVSSFDSGLSKANIGIYSFPIFLIDSDNESDNSNQSEVSISFFPTRIESTILKGKTSNYPFKIANTGTSTLNDIQIIYDKDVFKINPDFITTLSPNEKLDLDISLVGLENDLEDSIILKTSQGEFLLPIKIIVTENESSVETPYLNNFSNSTSGFLCAELDGEFCSTDQKCSGDTVSSLDGSCCLGTCSNSDSKKSYAWIGYLIGAILLIILVIILGRYLKSKKQTNPLDKRLFKIKTRNVP